MIMFYLMHKKSNALDKFKEFKVELENQLGKQLKVLQYDLCVEYMSSEFDFFPEGAWDCILIKCP